MTNTLFNKLVNAIKDGNNALVKKYIDDGHDVNITDSNGRNLLMFACIYSNIGIVKLLIKNGAHINQCDRAKNTALHYAVESRSKPSVVSVLLKSGAKVNAINHLTRTPLIEACCNGELRIVKMLLAYGANVNYYSKSHETPLTFAITWNHYRIVNQLLLSGADALGNTTDKWCPLEYANAEGNKSIARLLEKYIAQQSRRSSKRELGR